MDRFAGILTQTALSDRGIELATLGAAYLTLLASLVATAAIFAIVRAQLVISPNRAARAYAIYTTAVLATLLVATVLENELLPRAVLALQYVALPQLLMLIGLHLAIVRRQEPWLVALGGSAVAGSILTVAGLGAATQLVRTGLWVALLVLAALLVFLWLKCVSTKRAFTSAKSIYVGSKESVDVEEAAQKPWLGLPQWFALLAASVALAVANSLLGGRGLEEIPAVDVALQSGALLGVTVLVCAVPTASYWFARRAWMPELTRFVWLVWMVVSFAFTYGNYLNTLNRA